MGIIRRGFGCPDLDHCLQPADPKLCLLLIAAPLFISAAPHLAFMTGVGELCELLLSRQLGYLLIDGDDHYGD